MHHNGLRVSGCVIDAQHHVFRIHGAVRNALQVVEQGAGAAVLAQEQAVVAELKRSGNIESAACRMASKTLGSISAICSEGCGPEWVWEAASKSTGIPSLSATSRRRLSETMFPISSVTSASFASPASSTSALAISRSWTPLAGPHFRLAYPYIGRNSEGVMSALASPARNAGTPLCAADNPAVHANRMHVLMRLIIAPPGRRISPPPRARGAVGARRKRRPGVPLLGQASRKRHAQKQKEAKTVQCETVQMGSEGE
jgi:hypothetical protein